ncbi:hypothetical protein FHS31_002217 [Sphingomonas vulcanisoli]|uniref:Uncharacterized protein n=1 Tax=Sphingomonas vulcanisoli TaxID=1658060 RepID=A0ABX0TSV9_9SPHN|nr:hypothetical protein [Sphingomonas vulcanisoli]
MDGSLSFACPEPVEGLSFSSTQRTKQGFDKLSPSGVAYVGRK